MNPDLTALIKTLTESLHAPTAPTPADLHGLNQLITLAGLVCAQTYLPWTFGEGRWKRCRADRADTVSVLDEDAMIRIWIGGTSLTIQPTAGIEVAKGIADLILRARGYALCNDGAAPAEVTHA